MNVEPGVQIDLVGSLRRRAALIASVAGAVFLVAYLVAMSLPNEYMSHATILVEPPAVNERLIESGVASRDINTRLNLMTAQILSRPQLSSLIDELKLYEKESKEMTRAEVVDLMRRAIRIIPVEGALAASSRTSTPEINTFQIYFTSKSYAVPAKVAQKLAQDFIDQHIEDRVSITQKSFEFIESEQLRLSRSIEKVESKIADVKSENPGKLPSNLGGNQQQLNFIAGDLRASQDKLAVALMDQDFWASQDVALPPEGNPNDLSSPGRRLQILELALAEFVARGYTDKHPDVVNANQEIVAILASIEQAEESAESGERPMSFSQLSIQAEQKRAGLRVEAARARLVSIQAQIAGILERTAAIPRVAEQLDALQRQWFQLSKNLGEFENRRLKAFVQANLERRQLGEQFRILESAFPPLRPSSPDRVLILAIGAFLGLVIGAGVGIAIETLDSSVHGPRELQLALSIPVLAAVPAILLESDRIARFRKRLRYSLAAAAIVFVSLTGGAFSYITVNGAPGFLRALMAGDEEAPPAEGTGAEKSAWRAPLAPVLPSPLGSDLQPDGRG